MSQSKKSNHYSFALFIFSGLLSLGAVSADDRVGYMKTAVDGIYQGIEKNTAALHNISGRVKHFEKIIREAQDRIKSLNREIDNLKSDPNPANADANADKMALKQTEIDQLNQKIEESKNALNVKDPNHSGPEATNKGLKDKLADEIKTRESLHKELEKAKMDLARAEGRSETASTNSQAASKLKEADNLRKAAKELEKTNPEAAKAMREQADKIEQGIDKITEARYLQADGDAGASNALERATNDLAKMEPWKPAKTGTPIADNQATNTANYTNQVSQGAYATRSVGSNSARNSRGRTGLIHSVGRIVFGRRR